MPNISIPLIGGQNVDQPFNNVVVGSEAVNMTPEQAAGGLVLRNTPGFAADQSYTTTGNGDLLGTISVNENVYVVRKNGSDSELYEVDVLASTITLRGTMTNMSSACRLASNGENIVIINMTSVSANVDYVYDIATTTLATITSVDSDYQTLGRAIDVVYYQGYYFFINAEIVFHGDLRTEAGKGVAFNVLSFAPLPFVSNEGKGIEEVGGQIYAFGVTTTAIYNLVGTTPFVLQQQVGSDIDIGIASANTKVKVRNAVYLYGQQANEQLDFYKLTGLNFIRIGNNSQVLPVASLSSSINQAIMSAHISRGNTIVWFRETPSGRDTYAYNDTISTATSTKSWYLVGGYEESTDRERVNLLAGTLPILANLGSNPGAIPTGRKSRLFFVHAINGETDLYLSTYDENYTDISQDIISYTGDPLVTKFTFTFDYVRKDGDPISIKNIRFKLIDSGMTAELQFSDGTNNKTGAGIDAFPFTSLGEITPTSAGLVEWRRIGRVPDQRSFRLILSNPNNGGLLASVSGGIVSGGIEL